MDINSLLTQYFPTSKTPPSIDVFDAETIYAVYRKVIELLTRHMEIETTMLQGLSYCYYEVLDNVLTHSGKTLGSVLSYYDADAHSLRILVADDGIGVRASLASAEKYRNISEEEALLSCIKDSVTDGKGMGFGLYSTSLLAQNVAIQFEIRSGEHKLQLIQGNMCVSPADKWQGTLVFLELHTNQEIDPQSVVANRTDCVNEYNSLFLSDSKIDDLW